MRGYWVLSLCAAAQSAGTFTPAGNMAVPRVFHTATLLTNRKVLIVGSGAFARTGKLKTPRAGHTATLLPDGTVLLSWGAEAPGWAPLTSAEIYHPLVAIPAPVLNSLPDGSSQGAVLHAGTSDVVTAGHPASPGDVIEIYGTGLLDGSVIPPQVSIGGQMAEVLWFGDAPAYAGLNQINVRVPAGVTPGPSVPVRMNYLGRPSNLITIGAGQQ